MRRLRVALFLVAATSLLLAGCLGEDGSESSSQPVDGGQIPAPVTVVGIVTDVKDLTPSDGGVDILVKLEEGGEVLLLFGSLFTYPPPDAETLALYEIVRQVEIGDHVRASGTEVRRGIRIEELTILK